MFCAFLFLASFVSQVSKSKSQALRHVLKTQFFKFLLELGEVAQYRNSEIFGV
jgi:hypothetical protein